MSEKDLASTNGDMLVHIPMTLTKRQGRKQIILPAGSETAFARQDITADPVALAIAHRHYRSNDFRGNFRWHSDEQRCMFDVPQAELEY